MRRGGNCHWRYEGARVQRVWRWSTRTASTEVERRLDASLIGARRGYAVQPVRKRRSPVLSALLINCRCKPI